VNVRVLTVLVSCLCLQGCVTWVSPYDAKHPEEADKRLYDVTQTLLAQLDEEQNEALAELRQRVTPETVPCSEQYAPMYLEGYATGYAYFKLTRNWLCYWGGVEAATPQNAYLAGWYEGQLRVGQEGKSLDKSRLLKHPKDLLDAY